MNQIDKTAIIEGDVKMGTGNVILPFTYIRGPVIIGSNNIIGPHVAIGTPGQDTRNPRYFCDDKLIEIGDNNIIREFTGIQKPAYENLTKLGSGIYLMQSVHIPHDAIIEDDVVITPMVAMAGIVRILKASNIGMGATINQKNVIGQYSIVATGASAMKKVLPFSRYIPGKPISVNSYAVKKFGFEEYSDEISKYVLEGVTPKSEPILKVVEHYNKIASQSKLETY